MAPEAPQIVERFHDSVSAIVVFNYSSMVSACDRKMNYTQVIFKTNWSSTVFVRCYRFTAKPASQCQRFVSSGRKQLSGRKAAAGINQRWRKSPACVEVSEKFKHGTFCLYFDLSLELAVTTDGLHIVRTNVCILRLKVKMTKKNQSKFLHRYIFVTPTGFWLSITYDNFCGTVLKPNRFVRTVFRVTADR